MAIVWLIAFFLRKDLRKPMIWSGLYYMLVVTILVIIWKILFSFSMAQSGIIPNYWDPDTLFDLERTIGYSIEDALFMFFAGGIATFIYEFIFRKKIEVKKSYKHHLKAPIIGLVIATLVAAFIPINLIYSLIAFGLVGALTIWLERKDLVKHSLFGGFAFLITYFAAFLLFNLLFPDFVNTIYHLENTTNIFIINVPLEELLYAISFGMLWSPIYEYEHGEKDVDI